jgi:hypothetical protein
LLGLRVLGCLHRLGVSLEESDPSVKLIAGISEIGLRRFEVGRCFVHSERNCGVGLLVVVRGELELAVKVMVSVREIESSRLYVRLLHLKRRRGF